MANATSSTPVTVPEERSNFLQKLLLNQNYFGNIVDSPLKAVKPIKSNRTYEELKCVGFNPQLNRLEGVVWIKQNTGYNGGICTSGSQEYVSFFLSYDNGATWLPQGTIISGLRRAGSASAGICSEPGDPAEPEICL